jgi:uroporphyrin-III C-methyltransferase
MTIAQKGVVYLVGAGPGDPELLTLRAMRLLESADAVLHDGLVPPAILGCIPARAQLTNVEKRCGQKRITQAEIHALMIQAARSGQSVVRLKSGDPLVFGRAAEEIEALKQAGVPFEVVPGITAGFAAAASLQASLTDRRSASKIIFVTGQQATHHIQEQSANHEQDTTVWHGPLPEDATLIVYMPGRSYKTLAENLLREGLSGAMPCIAVSRACQPDQQTRACPLHELATLEPGPAPTLVLIGLPLANAAERTAALSAATLSLPAR